MSHDFQSRLVEAGLPGYWMHENGELPAAVRALLDYATKDGPEPTTTQLTLIVRYIQQWVRHPVWRVTAEEHEATDELEQLVLRANDLASLESIRRWLSEAIDCGIDPI